MTATSSDCLVMPLSYTGDMLNGMTTTRTIKRLVRQVMELTPAEQNLVIRELLDATGGIDGAFEAADRLGVVQTNLRPIPGLPEPIDKLRCGSVWLAGEVGEFAKQRASKQKAA
jgi:hypothetical protein